MIIKKDSQGFYWCLEEGKSPYDHYIIAKKYGDVTKDKNGDIVPDEKHFHFEQRFDKEFIHILCGFLKYCGGHKLPMLGGSIGHKGQKE